MKKTEPLQFALDFEIKGTETYLKLARRTKNPLGKQLFYTLAAQEVEHAKRADEIHRLLEEDESAHFTLSESLPAVESALKGFFIKAKKELLRKDLDNLSGYRLAMEMERKGYKAYKNFYDNTVSEAEKKFFGRLLEEEKTHLDSIANVYYYLTKTGDWLGEEESVTWNWMNL